DGSLLFLQHMISKMDKERGSRIGIVPNGSPLFNGSPGGGWSNIRKSFLDQNLLDCIVALPKNLFYGTDITTYLWILDNKRPAERKNKVLFINAVHAEYTRLLQKNLGKKRFEISDAGAADILSIYANYQNVTREIVYPKTGEVETLEVAKLLDYDEFFCTQVAIRRPLRLWYENLTARWQELCEQDGFNPDDKKYEGIRPALELPDIDIRRSDAELFAYLKANKQKVRKSKEYAVYRSLFGRVSEDAPEVHDDPFDASSPFIADSSLNDTERIPFKENIDEYFAKEVLPFTPDAWMDRTKDTIGVEFPFTRLFYIYRPLRSADEILADLAALDATTSTGFSK
ncbi:MAG: SAM-dependent methyltransferase, partial [Paramuribaculum sp.]|nr:SAM-dependent methyltransferase [Paramuribaculum sp.]